MLQVIYDAGMGSYIQSLTVPANVPTTSANTSMYQENGYYYIKLDKQSAGAVMVSLNGDMLYNDKDLTNYVKSLNTVQKNILLELNSFDLCVPENDMWRTTSKEIRTKFNPSKVDALSWMNNI